jgi:hypothetical protein
MGNEKEKNLNVMALIDEVVPDPNWENYDLENKPVPPTPTNIVSAEFLNGMSGSLKETIGKTSVDFIVERGANYEKWDSGKMVQWGKMAITPAVPLTRAIGVLFANQNTYELIFPIPFINNDVTVNASSSGFASTSVTSISSTLAGLQFLAGRNTDTVNTVNYIAIGRWK